MGRDNWETVRRERRWKSAFCGILIFRGVGVAPIKPADLSTNFSFTMFPVSSSLNFRALRSKGGKRSSGREDKYSKPAEIRSQISSKGSMSSC